MKTFKDFLNEAQVGILDENININAVNYGNPPIEYFELMQRPDDVIKNWFIEKGLVEKIKQEAPLNNSETTAKDLQTLVEKTANATAEEIQFARYVEDVSNLAQCFVDLLKEYDVEITMGDFFRVDSQTEGLLHFLKDIINRPRPYQLAKYYNYPLYPIIRTDAMSAAYPSGHALAGFVMSEYYSVKYPQAADKLKVLSEKIANSRELMGIHYPSDTQISREISDIIIKNNLLQ
jgi:acid phosphatase (class A)